MARYEKQVIWNKKFRGWDKEQIRLYRPSNSIKSNWSTQRKRGEKDKSNKQSFSDLWDNSKQSV